MTKKELETIEQTFLASGYRKWYDAKTDTHTAYEWMKHDEHDDYIISFRVWDFEKYRVGGGYAIDVLIVDTVNDIRTDFELTIHSKIDIQKIERIAHEHHKFLMQYL